MNPVWTESRGALVQVALDTLNTPYLTTMDNEESRLLYLEKYVAYMVFSYLGKEIAIYGTPQQKERILFLMNYVKYAWDENNRIYIPLEIPRNRMEHLTSHECIWSEELSDSINVMFKIREHPMTPLLNNMSKQMLFDIAPAIVYYGTESQLEHLETFIYTDNVHDRT
jgi:hypothetical protein